MLQAAAASLHQHAMEKTLLLFGHHSELEQELVNLLGHACGNLEAEAELMTLKDVSYFAT